MKTLCAYTNIMLAYMLVREIGTNMSKAEAKVHIGERAHQE